MSAYNGRRGPNVSQYIANLNTIPTGQDSLVDPVGHEEDLSIFTQADFIDWDADLNLNSPLDFIDNEQQHPNRQHPVNSHISAVDDTKMEFPITSEYQFTDFPGSFNPIVGRPMQSLPPSQSTYTVPNSFTSPVSASVSPVAPGFDHPLDEPARVAAEEDKRRRNTAASARFRVKKKQREQALEKTAKEMTDRVNMLESKIAQLETENAWLKSLVTEKGASGVKSSSSTTEVNSILQKRVDQNAGERSSGNRTDGVGTNSKGAKA